MTSTFPLPPLPKVRWSDEISVTAAMAALAPRVPWDKFVTQHLVWNRGEHYALIGPTGQGKTTMLLSLLPLRKYVAAFVTKPVDSTMDGLTKRGYVIWPKWRSMDAKDTPRRIIWPDARKLDSDEIQKDAFADAFRKIYLEGNWTVAIDETWYLTNILGLQKEIKMFLLQGRSLGISLLTATQRPAWVPTEIYSQSTHLMFWRDNDKRNLDRLSELSVEDPMLVRNIIKNLEMHQVLYVNTRTGRMFRTRTPRLESVA